MFNRQYDPWDDRYAAPPLWLLLLMGATSTALVTGLVLMLVRS